MCGDDGVGRRLLYSPYRPASGAPDLPAQKKVFWRVRDWADNGQRNVVLELRMKEEIQEKNELLFLSLEPQVTIIKAVIRKILVA